MEGAGDFPGLGDVCLEGICRAPSPASASEVPKDTFACDKMRFYLRKGVDLGFHMLGQFLITLSNCGLFE